MERVVIINRVAANFYKFSNNQFVLIKQFQNPIGRLRNKEMQHDKPGNSRAKFMGSAPHNLDREKNPHDDAAIQFANKLVGEIKNDLHKNNQLNLKIVAEAQMLGYLRSSINDSLFNQRIEWLEKDLVKVPKSKWPKIIGLKKSPPPVEISNRFPI
ncbi:MAG: host attachment protein [Bdellovibrionales bacterium]|nr:host attachment protein [Bdellovibrionales bacterium]